MLCIPRKSIAVIALTGALAVSAATPSEARWFGRGWGWGAAGIGLGIVAGAAIASAAASPYYGYGYGYPAYSYGYGYPAYGYGYDYGYPAYGYGPGYASYGYAGYGYGGYGYGGPGVYASFGYGSPGYGYASPYYGRSYIFASRSNRTYQVARSAASHTRYANVRARSVERAYAMAPRQGVQSNQRMYRTVAQTNGVKATRTSASNVRKPVVASAQQRVRSSGPAANQAQRAPGMHAASRATATISR